MKRAAWLVALCALAGAQFAGAAEIGVPFNRPGAFAPRNACTGVPGATTFLAELRRIVTRRDAGALDRIARDDVLLDFGGGAGRDELAQRLASAQGADLWHALAGLLKLGCAIDSEGQMVLPWIFTQDLGAADPFETMLALGTGVPVYRHGDAMGRPIARLSWQLATLVPEPRADRSMVRVSVPGSRIAGYVPAQYLRSVIGYRLVAVREGSGWKIAMLVAGD